MSKPPLDSGASIAPPALTAGPLDSTHHARPPAAGSTAVSVPGTAAGVDGEAATRPTGFGIIPGVSFSRHPILSGVVNSLLTLVIVAMLTLLVPLVWRRRVTGGPAEAP